MSHLNSTFDPDIDTFLDFDQAAFTPSSTSPDLPKGKAVANNRPSQSSSTGSFCQPVSEHSLGRAFNMTTTGTPLLSSY